MSYTKLMVGMFFATIAALSATSVSNVQAAFKTYQFNAFTKDTPYWSSLNMDVVVSEAGLGKVDFTFHNTSPVSSSIATIYFDDKSPLLLDIAQIIQGPGTAFSENPKPANLPAGETLPSPFEAIKEFSVGANSPPSKNGVNPGEWITIRFDLKTGDSYQSIIDELDDGALRVGLHVIGLPSGSESAVNIPEPVTLSLLAVGTAALLRRRKR